MANILIGTLVILKRPVIVKEALTRQGENGKPNMFVPAQVDMVDTAATVIGVDPQFDTEGGPMKPPYLTLSFLHPDRLHFLSGSGWRDAFDRLKNVIPQTDPLAMSEALVARWRGLDEPDLSPVAKKAKPAKATPVLPSKPAEVKNEGTKTEEPKA